MKLWILEGQRNDYNTGMERVAVFVKKPNLQLLARVLFDKTIEALSDDSIVGAVDILRGKEVRFGHLEYDDYQLTEISTVEPE